MTMTNKAATRTMRSGKSVVTAPAVSKKKRATRNTDSYTAGQFYVKEDLPREAVVLSAGGYCRGAYKQVIETWWEKYELAGHTEKRSVTASAIAKMHSMGVRFFTKLEPNKFVLEKPSSSKVSRKVLRALRREVLDQLSELDPSEQTKRRLAIMDARRVVSEAVDHVVGQVLPKELQLSKKKIATPTRTIKQEEDYKTPTKKSVAWVPATDAKPVPAFESVPSSRIPPSVKGAVAPKGSQEEHASPTTDSSVEVPALFHRRLAVPPLPSPPPEPTMELIHTVASTSEDDPFPLLIPSSWGSRDASLKTNLDQPSVPSTPTATMGSIQTEKELLPLLIPATWGSTTDDALMQVDDTSTPPLLPATSLDLTTVFDDEEEDGKGDMQLIVDDESSVSELIPWSDLNEPDQVQAAFVHVPPPPSIPAFKIPLPEGPTDYRDKVEKLEEAELMAQYWSSKSDALLDELIKEERNRLVEKSTSSGSF